MDILTIWSRYHTSSISLINAILIFLAIFKQKRLKLNKVMEFRIERDTKVPEEVTMKWIDMSEPPIAEGNST